MALEVPTLDRMLFMTVITINRKKSLWWEENSPNLHALLTPFGLYINFNVKNKVGGEASSLAR